MAVYLRMALDFWSSCLHQSAGITDKNHHPVLCRAGGLNPILLHARQALCQLGHLPVYWLVSNEQPCRGMTAYYILDIHQHVYWKDCIGWSRDKIRTNQINRPETVPEVTAFRLKKPFLLLLPLFLLLVLLSFWFGFLRQSLTLVSRLFYGPIPSCCA